MNRAQRRDEKKRKRRIAGVRKEWDRQQRKKVEETPASILNTTNVYKQEQGHS